MGKQKSRKRTSHNKLYLVGLFLMLVSILITYFTTGDLSILTDATISTIYTMGLIVFIGVLLSDIFKVKVQ